MALFRYATGGKLSPRSFYKGLSLCCGAVSVVVLVLWLCWLFTADMTWSAKTKRKLHDRMGQIYEQYEINGWSQCERVRRMYSGSSTALLRRCRSLEQMAFLIYTCPLIEFVILLGISQLSLLRYMTMNSGSMDENAPGSPHVDRLLKLTVFLVAVIVTGFWVGASTMGASMGLSTLYWASMCVGGGVCTLWLASSLDIQHVVHNASSSVIFKICRPLLSSDWFKAASLCFTKPFIVTFLLVEVLVACMLHIWGSRTQHRWITNRGARLCRFLGNLHWASVLQKAFILCSVYLVFFFSAKLTPVFLGWLNSKLRTVGFLWVVSIFYFVGLLMFLLPPVPGTPVYMAAGVIIVEQGRPWLGFVGGIAFTSALSLILKLNAVAIQQKGIGEACGKSLYVQQLVGVHTVSVRATEKILKQTGLNVKKVTILCGGPDWPVSVLTGILRLDIKQMLLGTLPCIILIVPCVFTGAGMLEARLSPVSPLLAIMVGLTQGGAMLIASIFIAREAERSHAELSTPLPGHKMLLERAEAVEQYDRHWKQHTEWANLGTAQKLTLLTAELLEWMVCCICTCFTSKFFRNFALSSRVESRFEDGGLEGTC